jgi:hypothetical protein
MALNHSLPVRPRQPDLAAIDPQNVIAEYDRESDTLIVQFFGRGRPAVILHTGGVTDYWLDPETHEIIGLQIEGYLTQAVYQLPLLLDLAEFVGIGSDEVAQIRQRISRERGILGIVEPLLAST